MKKLITVSAVALAAFSLAACSPSAETPSGEEVNVTGNWGDADAQGQPSLLLEEDGTVTGTDGCNRLSGSYEAEGTEITFGAFASTRMMCEGVDDWLNLAAKATVSATSMTVFDAAGAEIGTLDRK